MPAPTGAATSASASRPGSTAEVWTAPTRRARAATPPGTSRCRPGHGCVDRPGRGLMGEAGPVIGDSNRRARAVQHLVLDRVNPLLDESDRLEIRGGGLMWGVFRITDADERGPDGRRYTVHRVNEQGRVSYRASAVPGYSLALGSGLGTWIPLTPHPVRVKLALIEALENAARVASGGPVGDLDAIPTWPEPGAVARTRLRWDRVECWYENPATHRRWDLEPVLLADVPRRGSRI